MREILVSSPQKLVVGESRMIEFELWTEVHARFRRGQGKRTTARELGLDRKTVKRLLGQERPAPYQRTVSRPAVVAPYLDHIQRRVAEVDYNAYRIFQELQALGYPGGYEMVKLAVRPLRAERDRWLDATLRFETAPGRQAQVDWGTTWAQIDKQRVRIQLFVMVLGYSRRLYVECTRDQTVASLLACHQHAFDWYGGLTEEILYDNPKTVVLKRDWEDRVIEWHPQFWDFAGDQPLLSASHLCGAARRGPMGAGGDGAHLPSRDAHRTPSTAQRPTSAVRRSLPLSTPPAAAYPPTSAGRRPYRPGAGLLDGSVPGGGGAGVKRL
jgi:transposase